MDEQQPIISIIVPVYNEEKFLSKCLDSLLTQTMREIEVICVNDGSNDRSGEILDEYAAKDSRIKIFNQKNVGSSPARNRGLQQASGPYVMFVDSDDWIDAETCEVMYHALVTEHADIVQCSYVKEFGNHTNVVHVKDGNCVFAGQAVRDKVLLRLYGQLGEQLARPQEMDLPVAPWMQLFRKKMVDGIKFVDIKTVGSAEDLIFQVNAYVRCQKYVYLDRPFFHYRRSDMTTMTTTHTEDKYERWENLYDILEKTIETNGLDDRFRAALQNRVAVGLIGLGLNEIYSHRSRTADAKRLQEILTNPRYEAALHRLPFDYFPIHWRLFFRLCKKKKTRLLVELLHIMEFLRRKIR